MSQIAPLRIIFAGTPDFAALHLQSLLNDNSGLFEVIAAYSQPDRPAGRGKKLKPSPVKQLALEQDIPVYQPVNFKKEEDQQQLTDLNADLMIVVAYGLLLPKAVLETPKLGCINVHASLLPRWRGAAPIQRAIEAGDKESGVTIMQMDEGLDTGDMLFTAPCSIDANETGGSLHDKLATIGAPALLSTLDLICAGQLTPQAQQDELSNYAKKISKSDAVIDWQQSAEEINRKIRAFNPFPITYTALNNERIKIWQASLLEAAPAGPIGSIVLSDKKNIVVACGQGYLSLQVLQLPGAKALNVADVMNSKADLFAQGTCFDSLEPTAS